MMIVRLTWGLPIANRFAWNVLAVDAFRESLPVLKCLVESCGCVNGGEQIPILKTDFHAMIYIFQIINVPFIPQSSRS